MTLWTGPPKHVLMCQHPTHPRQASRQTPLFGPLWDPSDAHVSGVTCLRHPPPPALRQARRPRRGADAHANDAERAGGGTGTALEVSGQVRDRAIAVPLLGKPNSVSDLRIAYVRIA